MGIYKKIPKWADIASVYAIDVFIIYGWTVYWSIWRLPSWSYFLNYKQPLIIGAYSAAVNFLDCLLLLSVPIALIILLPKQWFSGRFISTGGLLSILLGGYFIYFSSIPDAVGSFSYTPLILAVVFFIVAIDPSILNGSCAHGSKFDWILCV